MNARERLAQLRAEREEGKATSAEDRLAQLRAERNAQEDTPKESAADRLNRLQERRRLEAELAEAQEAQATAGRRLAGEELSLTEKLLSGVTNWTEAATGWGDEAEAGIAALLNPDESYDDAFARVQQRQREWSEANPVSSGIGTASGIGAGVLGGAGAANKAMGASRSIGKAAGIGATEGAIIGAGANSEDRLQGAAVGGALGGAGAGAGQKLANVLERGAARRAGTEVAEEAVEEVSAVSRLADLRANRAVQAESAPKANITESFDADAADAVVRGEVAEQVYRARRNTAGVDEAVTEVETPEALSARISRELNVEDDEVLKAMVTKQFDELNKLSTKQLGEEAGDVIAKNDLSIRSGQDKNVVQKGLQNVQKVVAPIVTMVRHEVGEGFASAMSKGLSKALARKADLDVVTKKMEDIAVESANDKQLKAYLLNASNVNTTPAIRAEAWERAYARTAELTGRSLDDTKALYKEYMATHNGVVRNYDDVVGARLGEDILHSQKVAPTSTSTKRKTGEQSNIGRDEAFLNQSRPIFTAQNLDDVDEYLSPLVSDNRWMRERVQDVEIIDAFKIPRSTGSEADVEAITDGTFLLKRLEDEVRAKGGNAEAVAAINNLGTTALYDAMQTTRGVWQFARNANVATGLASPKSAFLNVLEPFNLLMSGKYRPDEVLRGMLSKWDDTALAADARELGLVAVQTGDELRKVMREAKGDTNWLNRVGDKIVSGSATVAEKAMKYGGQEAASLFGQNSVMRTAVKRAQGILKTKDGKVSKKGMDNFNKVYGDDFDKAEQARIVSGLVKLKQKKPLTPAEYEAVSYFQLVQLDKTQPLTAMGRSYLHNATPMARPLLLFTSFSTKLNDLITREAAKKLGKAVKTTSKTERAKLISEAVAGITYNAAIASGIWSISNQMRQQLFGKELNDFYKAVGILDEDYQEPRSGSEVADRQGYAEDFAYNFLTLPSGGLLPNNPYPYRPRNKVTVGEELDGEGVTVRYPDAEQIMTEAGDIMVPTFIPLEAYRQARQQESWVPIASRLPIVGPFLKAPAKQAEKKAEKESRRRDRR